MTICNQKSFRNAFQWKVFPSLSPRWATELSLDSINLVNQFGQFSELFRCSVMGLYYVVTLSKYLLPNCIVAAVVFILFRYTLCARLVANMQTPANLRRPIEHAKWEMENSIFHPISALASLERSRSDRFNCAMRGSRMVNVYEYRTVSGQIRIDQTPSSKFAICR